MLKNNLESELSYRLKNSLFLDRLMITEALNFLQDKLQKLNHMNSFQILI
jgi:hypothetical protein